MAARTKPTVDEAFFTQETVESLNEPTAHMAQVESPTTQLIPALIRAQQKIGMITKNKENPAFSRGGKKSMYLDLAGILEVALPALHEEGLTLTQRLDFATDVERPVIVTQLHHVSGEVLEPSYYPVIAKEIDDPQKFGAGVTYARRFALMAYLSLAAEDDDGNLAATPAPKPPTLKDELASALKAAGFTNKEEVQKALKEQFEGKKASVADLTDDEIRSWTKALTTPVPF